MRKVNCNKGTCIICHDKPAMSVTRRFLDPEQKRWGELCHRCYRRMRDSIMAATLAQTPIPQPLSPIGGKGEIQIGFPISLPLAGGKGLGIGVSEVAA